MKYTIIPIDKHLMEPIRKNLLDSSGNTLIIETVKSERSICRVCMQHFKLEERRIFFRYNPFTTDSIYTEIGPIYIHADQCDQPNDTEIPSSAFSNLPIILKGYNKNEELIDIQKVGKLAFDQSVMRLFSNPSIISIHVRDAEYGCYVAKLLKS